MRGRETVREKRQIKGKQRNTVEHVVDWILIDSTETS